jgi:hypothetical protein
VATDLGAVLLKETFDTPNRNGFSEDDTDDGAYRFVDGAYTITAKQPKLILWNIFKGTYDDAAVEVETTLDGPEQSATGLIFRYQDKANFYIFSVAGDGNYSLDVYKDDKLETLIDWTESPAINGPGELNTLRVEAVGDTIRLFANDQLLDEVSDTTFSSGKMGLAVNTFDDPDVTVSFDNLTVRKAK